MTMRKSLSAAALLLSLTGALSAQEKQEEDREGGIVGTGIMGVISELGSIHVNGHRIIFDPDLRVSGAVTQRIAAELVPGNTVAVVVVEEAPDWRAQSIRAVIPLAGPVEARNETSLTIMGRQVDATDTGTEGIVLGDRVAINGFWEGDRIVATLIEALPASASDMITGSLLGESSLGKLTIGGIQISGIVPEHIRPGDAVRVTGRAVEGGLEADSLATGIFDGTVAVVQAAGYLSTPEASGLYSLLGSGLVAYTDMPSMIDTTESTVRCGVDGQLLGPDDVEISEDVLRAWIALGCNQ